MVQRNFILTDVMKTGDHLSYEQFIDLNSLTDQYFEYSGEYYTLHNYNLKNFDRKFAFIDMRVHNDRLCDNIDYQNDLDNRMRKLYHLGFKFIIANPWESMHNIQTETFIANKKLKKIDICYPHMYWTGGTTWFWSHMYLKHRENKFKFDHSIKKYDFLYLNKFPRKHRLELFDRMKSNDLLDKSLYTFLGLEKPIRLPEQYELPWCKPEKYPQWGFDQDLYEKPYNETGFSLVSETNDTNDEIFITEKLWKPIIARHIFIVHGNYQYLKTLKELGFKTFNDFFDESYDEEKDRNKRINCLIELCKSLQGKDWQKIYEETKDIRDYNADRFFDKDYLSKAINQTILGFLKFADGSEISS